MSNRFYAQIDTLERKLFIVKDNNVYIITQYARFTEKNFISESTSTSNNDFIKFEQDYQLKSLLLNFMP